MVLDPYYNLTYGPGMEGILNYVNEITNSWFATLFLLFIFLVTMITLSKSEWKMSSVFSFAFFLVFISTMMMQLFMRVNSTILYISIIGLAISVFIGVWSNNK